jgi:hypothetical protein
VRAREANAYGDGVLASPPVTPDEVYRRRDLRRMAKLDAGFFYQVIADPKPSFREDGRCNHCAYVQPWCAAGIEVV